MCGCNKPVVVQGASAPLEPAPAPKSEQTSQSTEKSASASR